MFDGQTPCSEVWIAGQPEPMHVWGLTYDRSAGIRAAAYPRAVRFEDVYCLADRAEEAGDVYPGTWGLR